MLDSLITVFFCLVSCSIGYLLSDAALKWRESYDSFNEKRKPESPDIAVVTSISPNICFDR